jgi:hypothetical protein
MRVLLSTYGSRIRVNHAGSPSQDPEHENLPTLVT